MVTFSRKGRRQSEPAPAVKPGTGAEPESRKRPADVAAPGARPTQRPRLVPNGVLPAPKVPLRLLLFIRASREECQGIAKELSA